MENLEPQRSIIRGAQPSMVSVVASQGGTESMGPPQAIDDHGEKIRLKRLRKEEKRKKKEEKEERKKRKRHARESAAASIALTVDQATQGQQTVDELSSLMPDMKRRRPNELTVNSKALLTVSSLPLAADTTRQENAPLVDYSNEMKLKIDHHLRPATVLPTGYIYLDMNSPFSKPASDFLVTVAEPVSRPENIHEFQITVFSLYAAIGIGMTIEDIIVNLSKFSKNEIPPNLENLLRVHGNAFGRVKLVLRDNRYYLEAGSKEDLEFMLTIPTIAEARIRNSTAMRQVRTRPTSMKSSMEQMQEYVQQQMARYVAKDPQPSYEAPKQPKQQDPVVTESSLPIRRSGWQLTSAFRYGIAAPYSHNAPITFRPSVNNVRQSITNLQSRPGITIQPSLASSRINPLKRSSTLIGSPSRIKPSTDVSSKSLKPRSINTVPVKSSSIEPTVLARQTSAKLPLEVDQQQKLEPVAKPRLVHSDTYINQLQSTGEAKASMKVPSYYCTLQIPYIIPSMREQQLQMFPSVNSISDGLLKSDAATLDPSVLGFKLTAALEERNHHGTGDQQQPLTKPAPPRAGPLVLASPPPAPTLLRQVYLFEINADKVGRVKESALTELQRPLVSEYDFRRDHKNPSLDIALKSTTKIRYYQERALRKMFSNGRARSGIIVLPCGAGKTLTGITAATTVRKSAMVLTSSSVAVDQWKRSFTDFTTVDASRVISLTSEKKHDLPPGAVILCSTYTMMAYSGKRSAEAERIIQQIKSREWGLLIFDEVQFAPAPAFRRINDLVKSHCKLGLTATLVREDDLIHDLQWLIGPKLYEANWLELQEAGYLAKVQVSEVWCPMTADFYREYLRQPHAKQRKLWVCNPNKLRVCEFLIRFHEARNDKVIVFSDNLFALKEVAFALKRPFISGEVGLQERMIILGKFKHGYTLNTIFLSKVGDNAIDIPCANVVVQISFNFASRRQEAQRLGRILRPKPKAFEEFNAFFYSLVSKDTQEMMYADKRQQFIIDQGYAYKVLPISVFPMEEEELVFDDVIKQREMLRLILQTGDKDMDIEMDDVNLADSEVDQDEVAEAVKEKGTATGIAPKRTPLSRMTGRGGTHYKERKQRQTKTPAGQQKEVHPFFKSFYK